MTADAARQRYLRARALLEATAHSCERLLDAMRDERVALQNADTAAVNGAVSRKKIHLADLESHEAERKALLSACGSAVSLDAMQAFIRDNDDPRKTLATLWGQTLDLLAQCRAANNTNGAIIAAQRRQHNEALKVIRQQEAEPETYGPQGQTETTGQYRALAEV